MFFKELVNVSQEFFSFFKNFHKNVKKVSRISPSKSGYSDDLSEENDFVCQKPIKTKAIFVDLREKRETTKTL